MKNIALLISMLVIIQLSAQTKKQKFYPFKTAEIEYTYEGNTKGKQTLYIDNYGWLQCTVEETVSKSFGQKSEKNEVRVTKGLDVFQWDLKTRKGAKLHNTLAEDLMKDPNFDPEEFGKRTMESLGFEKTGTEKINGKLCEIWKGLGGSSTIWMWKSLTMKSEIKMLGTKTTWTATTVKIDEGVPAEKFDIPSDIKFGELGTTDPTEMMKKEMEKGTNNDDSVKKTPPVKSLKDLKGFLKNLKTN